MIHLILVLSAFSQDSIAQDYYTAINQDCCKYNSDCLIIFKTNPKTGMSKGQCVTAPKGANPEDNATATSQVPAATAPSSNTPPDVHKVSSEYQYEQYQQQNEGEDKY